MTPDLMLLILSAASLGFFHTLAGPDHYLPFIMMAWARKWSLRKTSLITFLCGLGHIASSVVLGLVGIAFGLVAKKLELFESARGSIAAWLLIAFGLVYMVWGIRRAYRNKPHTHSHVHFETGQHTHLHSHNDEHVHIHEEAKAPVNITPWVLFTIFVFGPCEPLIPLLMYPAAEESLFGMLLVTAVFGITTISTMMVIVLFAVKGVHVVRFNKLERFTHAIAGGTILLCGLAIQFLGL